MSCHASDNRNSCSSPEEVSILMCRLESPIAAMSASAFIACLPRSRSSQKCITFALFPRKCLNESYVTKIDSNRVNPENVALYGGVAGAALGVDEFEVCNDLVLRKTYAHVMSPYILAFRRPGPTDRTHPGPWKPARGGLWLDVEIEIALQQGARPTGFDRVNTLWWLLALIRLASCAPLKMPVVSDASYEFIADSSVEPNFWPVETQPQQIRTVAAPPKTIEKEHLLWVREAFLPGAKLMNDPAFNRAFQTLDGAIWAHSAGSALLTIWAALETLIRPGRHQITNKLASSLAAYLERPGPKRDQLFGRVKSLYEARGGSAHASHSPESHQLLSSFEIARRSLVLCIDREALPKVADLQELWQYNR